MIVDYHMHLRDPEGRIAHRVEAVEPFVETAARRGVDEIGPTLRDLRATLQSIQHVTDQLQANPAGYLLGRDHPAEFTPKH